MKTTTMTMSQAAFDKLKRIAKKERRSVSAQGGLIVEDALSAMSSDSIQRIQVPTGESATLLAEGRDDA